jgi:orotidine-5'-phosphate decarboxylase
MTKLIAALDTPSLDSALELVDRLDNTVEWFKIGSRMFCQAGPRAVEKIKAKGKKVFLDLKFHDIPNTVADAIKAAAETGADMMNVHASGGTEMMRAAIKAAEAAEKKPTLIAVTVLTSMDDAQLASVLGPGAENNPETHVQHLARLAENAGMDGVVCSAWEIETIRNATNADFKLIVPGIRPQGTAAGDQKRVATPALAADKGADFIVVGRPIYAAENPAQAAHAITAELNGYKQK